MLASSCTQLDLRRTRSFSSEGIERWIAFITAFHRTICPSAKKILHQRGSRRFVDLRNRCFFALPLLQSFVPKFYGKCCCFRMPASCTQDLRIRFFSSEDIEFRMAFIIAFHWMICSSAKKILQQQRWSKCFVELRNRCFFSFSEQFW